MATTTTPQVQSLPSLLYRIEQLGPDNWFSWKHCIQAILRDWGLLGYIDGLITAPLETKTVRYQQWKEYDAKVQTNLELTLGNDELDNLTWTTAREMWLSLCGLKDSTGKMAILRLRRSLYRTTMAKSADLVTHISSLKCYCNDLFELGNLIADDDFAMIILSSLLDSWENFNESYLGSHTDTTTTISSGKLIKILIDEEKRRKEQNVSGDVALLGLQQGKRKGTTSRQAEK